MDDASRFYVMVTGQIESAQVRSHGAKARLPALLVLTGVILRLQFEGYDRIFAKVNFVHNGEGVEDWQLVQGAEAGLTQVACPARDGDSSLFVLNYPLEVGYASTNVSGWPRCIVSVFGVNALGWHVLAGYGLVHVPTAPGRYERVLRMFRPASASLWQSINSFLFGDPPEFLNIASVLGEGAGREIARVESSGFVKLELNVTTKNMATYGYSECVGGFVHASSF